MLSKQLMTAVALGAALSMIACDKKEEAEPVETNEAAVAESETTAEPEPEPEPEPVLTDEQKEVRETPFGKYVEGADLVKVGVSHFESGTVNKTGVTRDPKVIASLIAAVGPDTMSEDPKSECVPKYYAVFFKGEDKLKSFKLWCDKDDSVPALYLADQQYTPADVKTAGKMINGILDGTYAEKTEE